jgi:hypothetical protein
MWHNVNNNCEKFHICSIKYTAIPSTKSVLQINRPNYFSGNHSIIEEELNYEEIQHNKVLSIQKRQMGILDFNQNYERAQTRVHSYPWLWCSLPRSEADRAGHEAAPCWCWSLSTLALIEACNGRPWQSQQLSSVSFLFFHSLAGASSCPGVLIQLYPYGRIHLFILFLVKIFYIYILH